MRHRSAWLSLLTALLLTARAAAADPAPPTGDKEKARAWAEKANERFEAGDHRGAVDAMLEAEKHYRAPTFAMLRAEALEKLGRLVEARDTFRSVAAWDLPPNAAEIWVTAAREAAPRAAALETRIPKLVIVTSGAKVTVDGAPLPPEMSGKPLPLDPGSHLVLAGEGDGAARREVVLREGATERLTISTPAAASSRSGAAPAVAAFGAGAAGLVAGAIFGGLAASKKDEVLTGVDRCGGACSAAEKARLEGVRADGTTFAHVSTAGFVLAGVGAAAGVTLLVLSRSGGGAGPSLEITTGSIRLSGRF